MSGYEPNYRDGVSIVVKPSAVAAFGFPGAGLLAQLRWWAAINQVDYFEASSNDLADLTGLKPHQVRTQVANLIKAGAIVRERQVGAHGETKPRFRVTVDEYGNPTNSAGEESHTPRGEESRTPRGEESLTPTYSREQKLDKDPPSPPGGEEEEDPPQLFDEAATKPERRNAKKAAESNPLIDAQFERWWKLNEFAGSKAKAKAKFSRLITREHESVAVLDAQADNYRAALALFESLHGDRPPTLHGTTFLNTQRHDFDAPLTDAEVSTRWPVKRKAETKKPPLTRDEVLARARSATQTG